MTWLMEILKIQLEEHLLIKYCVIKHLILLKIQNIMDTKEAMLQWSTNVLKKKPSDSVFGIKSENISNKELAEELHKGIIGKFKKKSTPIFYGQYL